MRLADHAAIGDGRTTALVASNGTIDWYAPEGIESPPSCFSLVDERAGGLVRLGPTRPDWTGSQRLADDEVPVVTTTFETPDGSFEVVDHLEHGRIVRVLTVLRGTADVRFDVVPGDAFGPPRRVERWSNGLAFGTLRVEGAEDGVSQLLRAGERLLVTVNAHREGGVTRLGPERSVPTIGEALKERADIRRRWRSDLGEVQGGGTYRVAVLRSVRALRLLTTGGFEAALIRALTTSLPARIGNERNVDERFAWLRDNAQAVTVWERLGRYGWADQHRRWLHDRAGDELPLAPVYRSDGERPRSEEETVHLGWRGNGPVRIGQRATSMLDLGAMAELSLVLDDRHSWPRLERLGDWLAAQALRVDSGRWDERSRTRHHVESVLGAHAALTALVATARRRNPIDPVTFTWLDALAQLDTWLRSDGCFGRHATAGWRRCGGALGDDSSDAALLRWISTGNPPELREDHESEARHRAGVTLDQSLAQLSEGPFTYRHLAHVDDGFPPGQGADLWASFTTVSALAVVGRWEEAHERMHALVAALGPTHIGATHIDPITGDLRGNLLAAPMHLALIEAALALDHGPR